MTDAISSISSNASSSLSASSSSSGKLTDETKKKLEALGIDTANVKTEAEGQAKLKEAHAAQAHQKPKGASPMASIEDGAKALASEMGVSVGSKDKLTDIFDNITAKLSELKASAGDDENKKAEVSNYENQYNTLYNEYSQMAAARNMTGASALANYNKAALGLAA